MKLDVVRAYALSLLEVVEAPHHQSSSFRVSGKIFLTVPPDALHVHVFIGEEQRALAMAQAPGDVEKLWWGDKVVGLRIKLASAKPELVKQWIAQSWEAKAPKALIVSRLVLPKRTSKLDAKPASKVTNLK